MKKKFIFERSENPLIIKVEQLWKDMKLIETPR